MDSTILAGIAAVSAAITGLLTIWNFLQSPSKKNAEAIAALTDLIGKLHEKVEGVDRRVAALEIAIKYVPSQDATHQLEVKLTQVSGQIDTLSSKLESVEHLSRRLQNMMVGGSQ